MKIFLDSLGCAKNLVDSEKTLSLFKQHGYSITNDPAIAEIIIVNTCGFIQEAREESIDTIFEYSLFKKHGKLKTLVLTGCLADMNAEELKKEFKEVDVVLPIKEISNFFKNKSDIVLSKDRHLLTPFGQAYLKIADGCSQTCSFCTIPSFKGPFVSTNFDDIIDEANILAKNGIKELNLVAQDLTSYGKDIGTSLPNLLTSLCKVKGINWIRLLYTFPDRIDDELIKVMANEEKICNFIDLPLQHLDDTILKSMRRWGNYEKYKNLIHKLRENVKNIAIRTSMIVGFPGETEEAFNNLLDRILEIKFDRLGVFEYSDEEGTRAFNLDNKVSTEIKKIRYNEVMMAQMEISAELLYNRINSNCDVLIEEISEDGTRIARSEHEAPEVDGCIFINNSDDEIGDIVRVKIIDSLEYDLLAEKL